MPVSVPVNCGGYDGGDSMIQGSSRPGSAMLEISQNGYPSSGSPNSQISPKRRAPSPPRTNLRVVIPTSQPRTEPEISVVSIFQENAPPPPPPNPFSLHIEGCPKLFSINYFYLARMQKVIVFLLLQFLIYSTACSVITNIYLVFHL